MDVKIRAYCHQEQLLLDTLPLLTYLLNPAFRPVINISYKILKNFLRFLKYSSNIFHQRKNIPTKLFSDV